MAHLNDGADMIFADYRVDLQQECRPEREFDGGGNSTSLVTLTSTTDADDVHATRVDSRGSRCYYVTVDEQGRSTFTVGMSIMSHDGKTIPRFDDFCVLPTCTRLGCTSIERMRAVVKRPR